MEPKFEQIIPLIKTLGGGGFARIILDVHILIVDGRYNYEKSKYKSGKNDANNRIQYCVGAQKNAKKLRI